MVAGGERIPLLPLVVFLGKPRLACTESQVWHAQVCPRRLRRTVAHAVLTLPLPR